MLFRSPGRQKIAAGLKDYFQWGAGPRASQFLVLGGKTRAALNGRPFVSTDDIRAVAAPVLRHRIITNFNAEADGVTPDVVVQRLLEMIPRDESEAAGRGKLPEVFRSTNAG